MIRHQTDHPHLNGGWVCSVLSILIHHWWGSGQALHKSDSVSKRGCGSCRPLGRMQAGCPCGPILQLVAKVSVLRWRFAPTGFVVMRLWVVERTHAWNERARRLIMHHDRLLTVSEAWVWLAEARILARRLTT